MKPELASPGTKRWGEFKWSPTRRIVGGWAAANMMLASLFIMSSSEVKANDAQRIEVIDIVPTSTQNTLPDPLEGIQLGNIQDIPTMLRLVPATEIQSVVHYLIVQKGLTSLGAAYLTGNFVWESSLDPTNNAGDGGTAYGLGQWRFERQDGVPADLFGQLDFALDIEMPRSGNAELAEMLRSPNSNIADLQNGIYNWELYGLEGERFTYGQQIYQQMTTKP